jgi:hypothetical protein
MFNREIILTGTGLRTGTLKRSGGMTGRGTWRGIRRRWGLSIVRSSRSFCCAAIRARWGVFGGVLLSLEFYQLKSKPN